MRLYKNLKKLKNGMVHLILKSDMIQMNQQLDLVIGIPLI